MEKKYPPLVTKIVRTEDTCGGLWRIDGTRFPVGTLARMWLREGWTIKRILDEYPHLRWEQVEDALRFFARLPKRERRRILRGEA